MPINWKGLDTVAPEGVNMAEALRRIGGDDPWQDFFIRGIPLGINLLRAPM